MVEIIDGMTLLVTITGWHIVGLGEGELVAVGKPSAAQLKVVRPPSLGRSDDCMPELRKGSANKVRGVL